MSYYLIDFENVQTDGVRNLTDMKSGDIIAIFNQYKTKQAICNGMSKKFKDSKRASAIYKKLKPLLKEKNKS